MKFTVRMFASTQDGHQFIHKSVDVPTSIWMQFVAWAVSHRNALVEVKNCGNEHQEAELWGPIYSTYSELTRALPMSFSQSPDGQAAIAHFFNLAIDNPELLPSQVPAMAEAIAA